MLQIWCIVKTKKHSPKPPANLSFLCLQGPQVNSLKEILTNIAEVLKLQDIPALQMQIVSLGHAYPDLR